MYAIYTFGPQIMTAFGLGVGKSAILDESVLSLFFLVGSLPAMFWLNSMGRRPLLIRSLFLMAVGLVAVSYTHLDVYKRQGECNGLQIDR